MSRIRYRLIGVRRRSLLVLLMLGVMACTLTPQRFWGYIQPAARAATTFTVTNTNDSGPGSLRQAILDANSNAGLDTIAFSIGSGVQTISLVSDLPIISDPVVIDGTTQPGFAGSPIIELKGNDAQTRPGLSITAGGSTVRGLVLNRFHTAAIGLSEGGGNRIEGNYIGTDVTGKISLFNGTGIGIASANNIIGGTQATKRNVISGNGGPGVSIGGGGAGNIVLGNYIGVDVTGTKRLGNNSDGVGLYGSANCIIGGTEPGAGNVISGNGSNGILVGGLNNLIQGNFIGTNASGTAPIPNSFRGVRLSSANTTVGGTTAAARNILSGNGEAGVSIEDNATGNVVQGNFIGTSADGKSAIPNSRFAGNAPGGVFIKYAQNNTIGGTSTGAGNVIAFNGTPGSAGQGGVIVVPVNTSVSQTGNTIRGNSIFSNGGLGIELIPYGVTPNDSGDGDAGANNLQNYPVLTSVNTAGGSTTIQGTLNSTSNTTFSLDFYSNGTCDPTGSGEGAIYIGSSMVTTDAGGNANFNAVLPVSLSAGRVVSATATDPAGSTSEFSACSAGSTSGSIQFSAASYSSAENQATATITVTRTGGATGALTVNYGTLDNNATAGADYTPTSGTIVFADGDTASKTFTIPILDDSFDETSESVMLFLKAADNADALGERNTVFLNITDNDASPVLSISDVTVTEGPGTTNAVFTVSLVGSTALEVSMDAETVDGNAYAGVDYQYREERLRLAPGETTKTFTVPIIDDTVGEPDENFVVLLNAVSNATLADSTATGTIKDDDPNPVNMIITEFRFGVSGSAPNAALDEYVELYNNSDSPLVVSTADGSDGWALVASDGAARFIIPNGTMIPARGHYLGVNSVGYSLNAYPAGSGTTATGDATYTADIPGPFGGGVALFRTAKPENFTLANRLDAAGFIGSGALYKEVGIDTIPVSSSGTYYIHARKIVDGRPQDTGDNRFDFRLISPIFDSGSVFGGPSPENLSSPTRHNDQITASLIDASVAESAAPNQVRTGSGNAGTLSIRRKFTNNTGENITRLRFLITDLSTFGNRLSGEADLRLISSSDITVTASDGTSMVVKGTTQEQPPQVVGGGINSTASIDAITLAQPLTSGASVNVQFLFNVMQEGTYKLKYDVLANTVPSQDVRAEIKTWKQGGRTYAHVLLTFPDSGYRVADWGQPSRSGSDFSVDASIQRLANPFVQTPVTTAQIFDLGELAAGGYSFTFKNLGSVLGTKQFSVTDSPAPANSIDDAAFFVTKQYEDFLGRQPDAPGLAFWTDNITKCNDPARRPADQTVAQCIDRQRETTSAAFFLSPEFQYTGYFVYRLYKGALGRAPFLSEFTQDRAIVGQGIVVNDQLSGAVINQNKLSLAQQFTQRAEFISAYGSLNNQDYVLKLFQMTGVTPTTQERDALIAGLNNGNETRATVLFKVVDGINVISEGNQQFTTTYGKAFYDKEFNAAFVQMQYFGYMRRDPDEAGYAFWLGKLNFYGNYIDAEMVRSFVVSPEYRSRFGHP